MIEYRKSVAADVDSLKELYSKVFQEKEEAIELFFQRIFAPEITYIATEDEKLVSMLFLLPCMVNGHKACYMFAVATDEKYRKHGIATQLIEFSLNNTDAEICITLPAQESLYDFYGNLGFVNLTANFAKVTRQELATNCKPYQVQDLVAKGYCGIRSRVLKNDFLFWNNNFLDFAFEYNRIYGAKVFKSNYGYAVAFDDNGVCKVIEMICDDKNACYLLTDILSEFHCNDFEFHLSPKQKFINSAEKTFGMVKYLSDYQPANIYCGLTLD